MPLLHMENDSSRQGLLSSSLPTSDSRGKAAVKKTLLTLNDLNERYVQTTWFTALASLAVYLAMAIAVSHRWFGFNYVDSAYFSVITLATVGYGDFKPSNQSQRMFVVFMILFGVAIASSLVSAITDVLQEHNDRMTEQRKVRTEKQLYKAIIGRRREKNHRINSRANSRASSRTQSRASRHLSRSSTLMSAALSTASDEEDFYLVKSGLSGIRIHVPVSALEDRTQDDPEQSLSEEELAELSSSTNQFVSLTNLTSLYSEAFTEDIRTLRSGAIINCATIIALVAIGALGICMIENWDGVTAVYWSTVTLCTVGYGDFTPKTKGGRVFTTLFVLSSCAFMAKNLMGLVKFPVLFRTRQNEMRFLRQFTEGLSKEQLESIFHSRFFELLPKLQAKKDELNRAEFTLLLLHLMNKIDVKEVLVANHLFDGLETQKTGTLTKDQLSAEIAAAFTEEQLEEKRRESKEVDLVKRMDSITGSFSRMLSSSSFHDLDADVNPNSSTSTAGAAAKPGDEYVLGKYSSVPKI